MARVRMSSLATCQLISQNVKIETIIHFTTRDRNLMGIQADLLGCQAFGIHNVIALTGDPPALGNYVHATAVYDVDSVGLIKIISQLNHGLDIAGNSIGTPTTLSIACALNPTHENRAQELDRFAKKIEAGAHFTMTQPLYQLSDLTNFLEEFGECKIPFSSASCHSHSFKHAEYLHNEVPGITIPDKVRKAMEKAGDQGAAVGSGACRRIVRTAASVSAKAPTSYHHSVVTTTCANLSNASNQNRTQKPVRSLRQVIPIWYFRLAISTSAVLQSLSAIYSPQKPESPQTAEGRTPLDFYRIYDRLRVSRLGR